jgi:hypothetical protein
MIFVKLIKPLFVILLFTSICLTVLPGSSRSRIAVAGGDYSKATAYSEDWRATGPPGGDVRGLVVDPQDPDRFYFGTLDGQIYASTDAAVTWHLLYNFNIPKLFVDHIIVDPRNSNTLYVGSHRHKEPGVFSSRSTGAIPGAPVQN